MNLYDTLDATYQRLARRLQQPEWQADHQTLDDLVAVIRDDRPDSARSDAILRRLLAAGRRDPDAWTVVLYALAPALWARTGRAATAEYRDDALTDLTFVLVDAIALDRPGLAHRLVNRAHNRTHKAAGRVNRRGTTQPVEIAPADPNRFAHHPSPVREVADVVADRIDLARFQAAVDAAVADGTVPAALWDAYRAHRLARAVDSTQPACNGTQRQLARRAAARLQPLIDAHLHAA